jgi:hypothetical protein
MKAISLDELKKMTALDLISLPRSVMIEDEGSVIALLKPVPLPIKDVDATRSARITELVRKSRELAARRTPEETAELQRWLDQRES